MPAHRQHKVGQEWFHHCELRNRVGKRGGERNKKAVTSTIQQKDNEHALALTEMRTVNKREIQKILQAIDTLSKRVDVIAIREGNKGDGGDNKNGGGVNNGGRCGGGGNHNTSGKNDNR